MQGRFFSLTNKIQFSDSKHQQSSPINTIKSKEKRTNERYREITDYKDNYSISLSLPLTSEEVILSKEEPQKLLNSSKKYIIEHAARRIDLFFYLLIAYYKTNHAIVQGDTLLQHGKGRRIKKKIGLTHACHSSFFPTLMDESKELKDAFCSSILSGTHFLDNLNSTVELPLFVNNFDCQLEGKISYPSKYRQDSLMIIQAVSQGLLTPTQGLTDFLKILSQAFDDLEMKKPVNKNSQPYLLRDSLVSPKNIKSDLIAFIKEGTFTDKWQVETKRVNPDYIEMMLRLTTDEKEKCKKSPEIRDEIYACKYQQLQNEILTTKTSLKTP